MNAGLLVMVVVWGCERKEPDAPTAGAAAPDYDLGDVPGDLAGPQGGYGVDGLGPDSPIGTRPEPCPVVEDFEVPEPVAGPRGDVDLAAFEAWRSTTIVSSEEGWTFFDDPFRILAFDSNGDGVDEVAMASNLGAFGESGDYAVSVVPHAPSSRVSPDSTVCARAWSREDIHVFDLQGAGDYDGDGYDDLIVHEELFDDVDSGALPSEAIWLVPGPLAGDSLIAEALALVADRDLGWVHNPADVTGDGVPDMIGSWYRGYPTIKDACVEIWHEALARPGSDVRATICRPNEDVAFAATVTAGSDVNGDGVYDLVVQGGGDSFDGFYDEAYLFLGPISGDQLSDSADRRFHRVSGYMKVANVAGGDLDGDGLDDVVVNRFDSFDWLFIYSGGELAEIGEPVDPTATILDCCSSSLGLSTTRTSLDISSDVDGDSIDDLLVSGSGSYSTTNGMGSTYLFYGPLSGSLRTLGDEDAWFHDSEYVPHNYPDDLPPQAGGAVLTHDFDMDGFADLILSDASGPDIHFFRGGY